MTQHFLPRDTQFAGFAKVVVGEIRNTFTEEGIYIEETWSNSDATMEQIIARRAYDLVAYTMRIMPHLIQAKPNIETVEEALHYIPDLTVLPREAEEQG